MWCAIYIAKSDRRGGASLQPLGIPEYPWEIIGIHYFIDLPKSCLYGHIAVFLMVCHLTKMAYFVPCHKKIIATELAILVISNYYRLHGVLKVIVSDRDPKFVGKFWESCMAKFNIKLNLSSVQHNRTDGLTEKVNQTIKTLLRCYCA